MRYMFTMMNTARIEVGAEGLAVGERAYHRPWPTPGTSRRVGRSEPNPVRPR
jgi:hypothetical protein